METRHFTRGPKHGAFTQQLRLRAPEFQTLASSVAGDHSGLPGHEPGSGVANKGSTVPVCPTCSHPPFPPPLEGGHTEPA